MGSFPMQKFSRTKSGFFKVHIWTLNFKGSFFCGLQWSSIACSGLLNLNFDHFQNLFHIFTKKKSTISKNTLVTLGVNVPEWFVKEGGELCLSDTENGLSIIRYWPKFLSEKGNTLMFKRLRKYCKWHQKQVNVNCIIPNLQG